MRAGLFSLAALAATVGALPTASDLVSRANGDSFGITYSGRGADNQCKDQRTVTNDFAQINGYNVVRIYGTDCPVEFVINAASAKGMTVFAGIFDVGNAQAEAQTLIQAVNGRWGSIDTVSVGNEYVNGGGNPDDVLGALSAVRPMLKNAGYNGPVVTVDTFVALIANPQLCQSSDYAAANIHAFFDGGQPASNAGPFVADQMGRVADACGKPVTVTETGWPWMGQTNNQAVPGVSEQEAAIASLRNTLQGKSTFLFNAFDDLWKTDNQFTFGAEKFWGIITHDT